MGQELKYKCPRCKNSSVRKAPKFCDVCTMELVGRKFVGGHTRRFTGGSADIHEQNY